MVNKEMTKKAGNIYWCMFVLIGYIFVFASCSNMDNDISSPNGKIKVIYNNQQGASFKISSATQSNPDTLIDVVTLSDIGLMTSMGGKDLKLVTVSEPKEVIEDYTMLQGKRSQCHNEAIERTYSFKDSTETNINIIFRVYNDGIAFRYTFPDADSIVVNDELTTYKIASGTKRWTQKLTESYEGFYNPNKDGVGGNKDGKWGYPALFEVSDSIWMLITEAGIDRGDCGSWLTNISDKSAYKVQLSEDKLTHGKGWYSPWRVVIIGGLSDIVESTLVTDVSEPCRLTDTSWIDPGMVSWIYWANNHGSKDFQIVKKYIDFAVDMRLPYVLIDWEWDEMANGGNLMDALQYAKDKGIKPLLWYNSSTAWIGDGAPGPLFRLNTPEGREKEFKYLSELGVKGIKVDFFRQDSVSTMNYFIDLLEDAAKHKLMVNLHGATIPRGWQRTYPNMMTVEGVYGAEWYNNNPVLTDKAASHNATLPFTRNIVGPMDYTPCTFTDSQHPHITSHGHELALLVLFESAQQHLADRPEGYLSQPLSVQSFISNLPTTWDETKLLSGYPGVEVVLARRKKDVWYIAGINGTDEKRTLRFSLSALPDYRKTLTLFKDGINDRSFTIDENISIANKSSSYEIDCLARGGFVAVIK